jgi:hypothetical protein
MKIKQLVALFCVCVCVYIYIYNINIKAKIIQEKVTDEESNVWGTIHKLVNQYRCIKGAVALTSW